MKRGPFEVTSKKRVYKNRWIEVHEDKVVRPNGTKGVFGIVEGNSGSTVAALNNENEIYLAKEYHYAQDATTYELPSGAIDDGETPIDAAKRELKKETGLTAKKWTDLGVINPLTVVLRAPNHMFLAEDLEKGEAEDSEKALIQLEKVLFEKVLTMVSKGEITHTASVVAILKVAKSKKLY